MLASPVQQLEHQCAHVRCDPRPSIQGFAKPSRCDPFISAAQNKGNLMLCWTSPALGAQCSLNLGSSGVFYFTTLQILKDYAIKCGRHLQMITEAAVGKRAQSRWQLQRVCVSNSSFGM